MTEFSKMFIDTAPVIYLLENNPLYHQRMKRFLLECLEDNVELVTSVITIEEYCVFPYRNNNEEIVSKFFSFIEDLQIEIIPVGKEIAKKAAQIRAEYSGFKAMDAIQLATAYQVGCDIFLTNDKQLKSFKELNCILVDELED